MSNKLYEDIFAKLMVKFSSSGIDFCGMKEQIDSLVSSVEFLNDMVEKLHAEKTSLVNENNELKLQNTLTYCGMQKNLTGKEYSLASCTI